jgi:hypothetical protein
MKKLFLVILVIIGIGCLICCPNKSVDETSMVEESPSKEEQDLKSPMDTAKILTYVDKTYNVRVPYPSYFVATDTSEAGTARFCYPGNLVRKMTLTMFVEPNVEGWTIKDAVEHLSDSTTICMDSNESFFIMYGKGENDSRDCYVEKCFLVNDYWIDYTLFYRPECEERDGMEKLMAMVMKWEPFR